MALITEEGNLTDTNYLEEAKRVARRRRTTFDADFELKVAQLNALIAIAELLKEKN
ncbi:hypothetical protein SEA_KERBEROS_46 [Mycobacterium phage Kerberos]|nr:hypothetical protein SEA_KERBEROS_46 [Mycobacterium phage Kerberos]AXH48908.1 hypothetical protein SEA_TOMATHAN_46 [Mycobacterium phage Tomathan]